MSKTFANLTPAQHAVFEQIATGNDAGHNPRTLAALAKKGMIEPYNERHRDELGPYEITRFFVPVPVHIRWCQWCAEQPEEEEAAE